VTITRDPIRDMHRELGIKESLKDIGTELVDHSQQEFTAERSALEELFPYIIIASKTMSARAISRWFKDEKNIPISAASAAKAIREQDRYCELIYKRARVGADYLAGISNFNPDAILVNQNGEWKTINSEYETKLNGTAEEKARAAALITGMKMLNEWNDLPEEIRNLCIEKCITNKKKGRDEK
jgi:hypothetical protein